MLSGKDDVYKNDEERKGLCSIFERMKKYDYHRAAPMGEMPDGTMLTSEMFAAETKQYVVAPFSQKGKAIGRYKKTRKEAPKGLNDSGFIDYYNMDNAIPSLEEQIYVKAKMDMLEQHR